MTSTEKRNATTHASSTEKQHEAAKEAELLSNGRWAAVITLMCYFYGNMTVASQLPKDPRQSNWILTQSPVPSLIFCLAYIVAVTWWGPWLMRNRQPVRGLRHVMMFYNAFQVVFNTYIFYTGGVNGWFGTYSLVCEPCNFSNQAKPLAMLNIAYWYYISKFVDFIDTFFFVVHKKYDHISLLHVSHHALMPISTWFGVRYQPGGHTTFMGFLNSFVHILMYSYYLLAAMGPRIRPYLWWKKYLTTIQMLQFIAMFFHSMTTLVFLDCNVPYQFARWVGLMAFVFQILFTDFYIKAYRKKGAPLLACKLDSDFTSNGMRTTYKMAELGPSAETGAISKTAPIAPLSEKNGDVRNGSEAILRNRVAVS